MRSRSYWIAGVVSVFVIGAFSLASAFREPDQFLRSYLFSFLFWIDLPLGALPLLMIYHLTGGAWGSAVRRILEAAASTLPIFVIFSLPILVWVGKLYPWMRPEIAQSPVVLHKQAYLNAGAFIVRTLLYFACWIGLSHSLRRASAEKEETKSPAADARLRKLSAGGLVLLTFTVTFAAIDWQMSVEPKWYSTIYGMLYEVGQTLQSYAFVLIAFGISAARSSMERRFTRKVLLDLGNLLLTLVILWTYLSFMQYLIVWAGDLPHEVTWFVHRTHGGWQWLILLMAAFQFAAPFLFLLFRSSKQAPRRLLFLGLGMLLIRVVDHYWMLMPGFSPSDFTLPWQAIALWFVVGAIWVGIFVARFSPKPWFAESDRDWSLAYLAPEEGKPRG